MFYPSVCIYTCLLMPLVRPCFTYSHPAALMRQIDALHVRPTKHLPWFTFCIMGCCGRNEARSVTSSYKLICSSLNTQAAWSLPRLTDSLIHLLSQSMPFQVPSFTQPDQCTNSDTEVKQTKRVLHLPLAKS